MEFKHLTKETFFAGLLVFLLPFQTRYLFPFPESVALHGDLTVFSLYAVEVLVLLGILVFRGRVELRARVVPWLLVGTGFLLLALTSALWAPVPLASVHFSAHVAIALLLLVLLTDERVNRLVVARVFILGLVFPVILSVYQVLVGSFPPSKLLGIAERSAQTLGDSVVFFADMRILRGYGTFSHPNIFGGVLAVGLLALIIFPLFQKRLRVFLGGVLALGLILTFSQGAWIAFCVGALAHVLRVSRRTLAFFFVGCVGVSLGFLLLAPMISIPSPASISERVLQAETARTLIQRSPLVGTGAGNYLHTLFVRDPGNPWYAYQPVHNTYLLLFLEFGVLLLPLVLLLRKKTILYPVFYATLATLALFDHYLITQWSGLALIVTVLALLDSDC